MSTDPMPVSNAGHEQRVDQIERRQDRLESEVGHLVKSMETLGSQIGGLNDKLSGFLREFNQRNRTDWKTILTALGVLVTIGVAAIGAAAWIITTLETSREAKLTQMIESHAELNAASMTALVEAMDAANRRRDQIDARIIDDYRRDDDALARRIERLETLRMESPQ